MHPRSDVIPFMDSYSFSFQIVLSKNFRLPGEAFLWSLQSCEKVEYGNAIRQSSIPLSISKASSLGELRLHSVPPKYKYHKKSSSKILK